MRLIVGTLIVFACVFGSYAAMGGHLEVLWQPFEFVIILGAAIGAFIIGNTGPAKDSEFVRTSARRPRGTG